MTQSRTYRAARRPPPPPPQPAWRRYFFPTLFSFLLLAFVVLLALRPPAPPRGTESFEVPSREHVSGPVTYPQVPPVGGDHAPQWQNCGFYSSPIPNETAVHSLEHGAVWITYRPDAFPDQVNRIRQVTARQNFVLASPYPDLPAPVVVSAWGRQLKLESAEDPRLEEFIAAFKQGPTAPERNQPCGGGVGTPR